MQLRVPANRSGSDTAELQKANKIAREECNRLYDVLRQIATATDGSRWKEAKEANRLAREALH